MSAATTVNVFAEAVLRTGSMPVKLDGAPNLREHQTTSKNVAGDWINSVRIDIYQANADLGAYSTKFQNFYTTLYKLAGDLTDENKVAFTKGLSLLQTQLANNLQSSKAAIKKLQDFNLRLDASVADMLTDYVNINATYGGDVGQLANLQRDIDAANKAQSTDIEMIAAVGVLAEIETAGASTALVVVGIAGEAGSGTAIGIASADLVKQEKVVRDDTTKIASLKAEIALIQTVSGQLSQLLVRGRAAEEALSGLVKQWQVMDTQLKTVVDAVDGMSVDDGIFLQAELDSSNTAWQKTQQTVNLITDQLVGIPVVETKSTLALSVLLGASASPRNMLANRAALAPTTASASASGNAMVSDLRAMDTTVAQISASLVHQPPMVSEAKPQLVAVTSEAKTVQVSSTKVAYDLSAIAREWIPSLTEIAQSPHPDLGNARVQVQGLSKSLQGATKDIEAAQSAAASMNTATANAIATLTVVVNKLFAKDASLEADVKSLQNQISQLSTKIAADRVYEEVGWILGPLGYLIAKEIGDLVDDVSGKEAQINAEEGQINADRQTIQQITSSLAWCKSTSAYAYKLQTQVSGLLLAVQALHTELNAASDEANPDNLFQIWVSSQVGSIVSALNQLVTPQATSSFAVIRPAMAAKAARIASTLDSFSVETSAGLLGNMTSGLITTTNAARLILQQPKLQFLLVPTVVTDQAVLGTTCEDWVYDYSEDVVRTLSSTASVSDLLQKLFSSMINMTDVESDQLTAGLEIAERRLEKLRDQVDRASRSLEVDFLRLELAKNTAALGVDRIQVQNKYSGDGGVLAKIQEEITTTQREIDAYQAKLATGATSTVVKALAAELAIGVAAGIGALTLPAAAEGASELTVLAYKGAKAAVTTSSKSTEKWATAELLAIIGGEETEEEGQDQIDKLRNLVIKEAQLQSAFTSFAVVSQQVDTLQSAAQNLADAVDCIPPEIDILLRDISLLLVKVKAGQCIKDDLAALLTACGQLSTVCDNLTNSYLASGINMTDQSDA